MEVDDDNKEKLKMVCSICGGDSHGIHFGAEACRACSAFFRRTIALKLGYQCRGNGNCEISKEYRCLCRYCRYEKCLKSGMRPGNVQLNKFDPLPSIKGETSFDSSNRTQNAGQSPLSEASSAFDPVVTLSTTKSSDLPHLDLKPSPIQEQQPDKNSGVGSSELEVCKMAMTSIFNKAHSEVLTTPISLIESMKMSYRRMQERRKVCQLVTLNEPNNLVSIFGTEKKPEIINTSEFHCREHVKNCKLQLTLFAEFCSEIKYFADFSTEQKMNLFKQCSRRLLFIDAAYETYTLLGTDESDTRLIIYNNQAFDVYNVTCSETETKNMGKDEIQRMFSPSVRQMYEQIVRPMKRLQPSEFEYLAMLGLILWKSEAPDPLLFPIQFVLKTAKEEILQSLHEYFISERKLFCYAQRLAEMLSIVGAVDKAIEKTSEDAVLAELFDVFKFDIYLSKLLD